MSKQKENPSISVPSYDSFKFKIELSQIDVLNDNITDHRIKQVINSTTGEVIEETPIQQNSLQIPFEKYHIHFAINKIFGVEYIVVLINSKLLQSNYRDGISMNNIEAIYNQIMSCEVFHCSFEQFLKDGEYSDVDIKRDEILPPKEFKDAVKTFEKMSVPQKKSKHGVNAFTKNDNLGVEWNNRAGASYAHPFLKLYHKEIEAKHSKNSDFFNHYLEPEELNNVVRIECTLKNSHDAKKHGFKDNKLITLLSATREQLNAIISHSIESNLEKRIKKIERRTKSKLNNSALVQFLLLNKLIQDDGLTFENALFFILEHTNDKMNKTRLKKSLTKVYEETIQGEKYEVKINSINNFFDSIGWG